MFSHQEERHPAVPPLFHRFIWHSNTALKSVLRYFIFGGKWHVKIIFKFGLSIMQVLCPRHLIPKDTVTFKKSTIWNTWGKIKFSTLLDYLPQAPSNIFHCFFFGTISFVSFCVKTGQGFCNKPKIFTRFSVVLLWNLRLSPLSTSFCCQDKFKN